MCGVSGFFSKSCDLDVLKNMSTELMHRGPDDTGYWLDYNHNVYLAHQRLSILDLSNFGKQPMISISGNYILSFNGEIYNHLQLRLELQNTYNIQWKGNSDTETLLACIDYIGLENTLKKLIGMFAFALYDKLNQNIILVRDRMGEKPIYYGHENKNFIFASELSALKKFEKFNFEIDQESVSYFINYGYVPSNLSIYKNIFQVPPGTYLIYSINKNKTNIYKYWELKKIIDNNESEVQDRLHIKNEIKSELNNSVNLQSLSDVPIGCFLSSGTDSSLIASILQSQQSSSIKTFSIGFEDNNFNEAKNSKKIAKYLGTDHHELYINEKKMLDVVYNLKNIYSEPFADSSQIPTYLLSKLTSKYVKVALSGDGADEIFGGYNRHKIAKKLNNYFKIPLSFRMIISKCIKLISTSQYEKFFTILNNLTSQKIISQNIGDKIYKLSRILPSNSVDEIYNLLTISFSENNILSNQEQLNIKKNYTLNSNLDHLTKFMLEDSLGYLNEDIITKVDRASMKNSLETRMPFLNHNLVTKAFKIPSNLRIYKNQTKYILRNILSDYLPGELISQQKSGFAVPLGRWLRKDLREWRNDLINSIDNQFFNLRTIYKINQDLMKENTNNEYLIWNILIFQDWYLNNQK